MNSIEAVSRAAIDFNRLRRWLAVAAAVVLCALIILIWQGRILPSIMLVAFPLALLIVTRPRLIVLQYIICLFISRTVVESVPLTLTDLSSFLVILAAALDLLLRESRPGHWPALSTSFLLLFISLVITGLFAENLAAASRAIARAGVLLLVFLSLCRLMRTVTPSFIVKFYFFNCVVHSIVAIVPFVISGGAERSFGLAPAFLDNLAAIGLPVGLALYLWSERGKGLPYIVGAVVVLGGLVATQTRFAILLACGLSLIAIVISALRSRISRDTTIRSAGLPAQLLRPPVRNRLLVTAGLAAGIGLTLLIVTPGLLGVVIERFQELSSRLPAGTVRTRLILWRWAIEAFLDNPLTGLGPGNYKLLYVLHPSAHLNIVSYYVRGLAAHNLLLHYLAETGVIGATALVALIVNQFRLSRHSWLRARFGRARQASAAIYIIGTMILITSVLEADWMWGFAGYNFAMYLAIISVNHRHANT